MIEKNRIAYGVLLFLALINLLFPPRNIRTISETKSRKISEDFTSQGYLYGVVLKMREGKVGTKFLLEFEGNTGKIKTKTQKKFKDL